MDPHSTSASPSRFLLYIARRDEPHACAGHAPGRGGYSITLPRACARPGRRGAALRRGELGAQGHSPRQGRPSRLLAWLVPGITAILQGRHRSPKQGQTELVPPLVFRHHVRARPLSCSSLVASKPSPVRRAAPSPCRRRCRGQCRAALLGAPGEATAGPAKVTSHPNKVSSSPWWFPPAKSGRRQPPIPPPARSRPARGPNCFDCIVSRVFFAM
jgi:hypothetical protein